LVIILSSINAENVALTLILAASILCPAASGVGGPSHAVGSGPDNWWIEYPHQHLNAGSAVDHPSWALDALKEKPVIMLVHQNGCHACALQEVEIGKVLEGLGGDAAYIDILVNDDLEKGWTALKVYDPSGEPKFVPLTVFLTLAPGPDGNVTVAWHSVVDHKDEGWIRSYLNDAIALYRANSEGWNR
jgi:hypothetical protein